MLAIMSDDRTYWYNINGKQVPDEENMLSKLLEDGVLFCNTRKYVEINTSTIREETIVLFINCNDTFYPAADAESLTTDDLPILFSLYESNQYWGVVEFVAKKRNLQPMTEIKERMITLGFWTDELEKLNKSKI